MSKEKDHINSALNKLLLKNRKLDDGLHLVDIEKLWSELMTEEVVEYTSDISFKKGVLKIKISSSALRQNLSYRQNAIKDELNAKLKADIIKSLILA